MEVRLRLIFAATNFLSWLIYPIFWLKTLQTRRKVPPIEDALLTMSATFLSEKIRKREITSEQVIMAYIKRIKQVNPIINAVVEEQFVVALEEAKAIDTALLANEIDIEELKITKPLLGVPVTIKESVGLKGMSFSVGSKQRMGFKATEDGGAVVHLRSAGAIPLLVSNTPEYCLYWETNNLVTGCTRNPYNTHYTSGGSSGGEGALLGSGASVIGIGSDVAGSIRLPAMFNGIFGHKPSTGLVSLKNHFPKADKPEIGKYLAIGPMTRYAEDLRLVMSVIAEDKSIMEGKVDLFNITVYHMTEAGKSLVMSSVDKEIKQLIERCITHLQNNCRSVISNHKFKMEDSMEMATSIFYDIDDLPNILKKDEDNLFVELIKSTGHMSNYSRNGLVYQFLNNNNGFVPKNKCLKYFEESELLKADLQEKLGENGILLYPTYPSAAFQHDQFCLKTSGILYMMLFNIFGLPSTHVPLGLNKHGMPIGIQVVAGINNDKLCLTVAEELELAFGGWTPPS